MKKIGRIPKNNEQISLSKTNTIYVIKTIFLRTSTRIRY
ncbi:hypothetical protein J2Z26_000969 [Bacillus luteolus]|nr:hypothetical protein [Cytobacillus luteolus]